MHAYLALLTAIMLLALTLAAPALSLSSPARAADACWHEGEDIATAPEGLERTDGDNEPASGGKSLAGAALNKEGSMVTYAVELPAAIEEGRIFFRYARLHWREDMKPADVEMKLSPPEGEAIVRRLAFDNTGGWGKQPAHWKLVSADLGKLAAGKYTLSLTSGPGGGDLNLDGFLIAPAAVNLTAEELSALVRLKISHEGYLGLAGGSIMINQKQQKELVVAARNWAGKEVRTVRLGYVLDKEVAFPPVSEEVSDEAGRKTFSFPVQPLDDGSVRLLIAGNGLNLTLSVLYTGQLMAELPGQIEALETFAAGLKDQPNTAARQVEADFAHAIEFLKTGLEQMQKTSAMAEVDPRKAHLAAHEGSTSDAPPAERLRKTAAQSAETMKLMKAGKQPYAGRSGDFRRALRSKASGKLDIYRLFVPQKYLRGDKVPLVLALHGGGGDENYFPEMEDGKILKIADERGYMLAAPRGHFRSRETWFEDMVQLIDQLKAEYPQIDADRVYVTGISMGGHGSAMLASRHPQLFAAITCVSGVATAETVDSLRNVPVQILHGGSDDVVPLSRVQPVADRLKELGYTVEMHVFPPHGHAYNAEKYWPLTLDWFDKHTRKQD